MEKVKGKDVKDYNEADIDALLQSLSPEELEQLGEDLIDPDDSMIPPSDRCKYRLDKEATGPYNRKALVDFLEKKAKEEPDWEEVKPYLREIRGKVFVPKKEEIKLSEDGEVDTEWDEVLQNATEEELVDLAAILGFHGMLNQVQYHNAFVECKDDEQKEKDKAEGLGFSGCAKHENFKLYKEEAPNTTDIEEAIKKLTDNDSTMKSVNLNNMKNIPIDRLSALGEAIKKNTVLEELHMCNTGSTDRVAKALAKGLEENETLDILNIESNYIGGEGIVALVEGINKNKSVTEFRIANQRPAIIGMRPEQKIADLIRENETLLQFGIYLNTDDAKVRVRDYIKRNNDTVRKERVGKKEDKKEDK